MDIQCLNCKLYKLPQLLIIKSIATVLMLCIVTGWRIHSHPHTWCSQSQGSSHVLISSVWGRMWEPIVVVLKKAYYVPKNSLCGLIEPIRICMWYTHKSSPIAGELASSSKEGSECWDLNEVSGIHLLPLDKLNNIIKCWWLLGQPAESPNHTLTDKN